MLGVNAAKSSLVVTVNHTYTMYQPLVVWVELEANPALHVLCEIGVQALDSVSVPLYHIHQDTNEPMNQ